MAKTPKVSTLKNKLDKIFSEYIRLRDTDHTGYGTCIDCGRVAPYDELDCGHFQGRRHLATRWDEQNCNAQHRYCNRFLNGRQYEYGLAIDEKYGEGTADALVQKSREVFKINAQYLQWQIDIYKGKIEELKKSR